MKHFTTEEWIDFVNQVVSPSALDEMENHLKQGCKRCQEAVSVWQRAQKSAVAAKNYQPPGETLTIVKAGRFCRRGFARPKTGIPMKRRTANWPLPFRTRLVAQQVKTAVG